MKKMRHFLDNPKKVMLAAGCTAAILSVGGISTVYASGVLAQSSGIGEENAKKFACADAGVLLTDAQNMQVEFDYERGQYVYEVEFFANGTEYEYWIKASDGAVVKKELELKVYSKSKETKPIAAAEPEEKTETSQKKEDGKQPVQQPKTELKTEMKPAGDIGMEKAKEIALNHAAVSQVTFTKAKLDKEDGILVYEVEFVKDKVEYEYTIQAAMEQSWNRMWIGKTRNITTMMTGMVR